MFNRIIDRLSLLFPEGYEDQKNQPETNTFEALINDLELNRVILTMSSNRSYNSLLKSMVYYISDIPEIIQYRLDIIEDLLENPEISNVFEEVLPMIKELFDFNQTGDFTDDPASHIAMLGEIELYIECINKLHFCFSREGCNLKSQGLLKLKHSLEYIAGTEDFKVLVKEYDAAKSGFKGISSVTIGINLDAQLRPTEATLVSINEQKYKSGSILDKLLNLGHSKDTFHGISPLQVVVKKNGAEAQNHILQQAIHNSLNAILKSSVKSFTPVIKAYTRENGRFLSLMGTEIVFYLGAVKLIRLMKDVGLPICKPTVLPKEERKIAIKNIYNLNLALKLRESNTENNIFNNMVLNDIEFGDDGRIFVLTGPNQGGKTTFTQAVGIAQFIFQLGIYVPGSEAAISPVDQIHTHFPVEEKATTYMGKLGEECCRLQNIFTTITKYSLVLLNEALSSTSPGEGFYIAKEVLLGLRLSGCRAIFATHFHELGENLDETNSIIQGDSKIDSLVAGINCKSGQDASFNKRSYKITREAPSGMSYAKDIAFKYGISLDKISSLLKNA